MRNSDRDILQPPRFLATAIDVGLLLVPFLAVWWLFGQYNGWPHEDDHVYGRSVQWAVDDGRYQLARLKGLLSASTVSHVAAGVGICKLLGFSYRHLFLACILQQWLGSAAIYGVGRMTFKGRAWPMLLALTFALCPWYFGHAFTFMTDGPGAAWGAMAGFAAVRAFSTQRLRWLVVCSAAVSWGFWMRQTNLVLIGAPLTALTLLSLFGRSPFRYLRGVACLLLLPVAAILLLESGWVVDGNAQRYEYFAWQITGFARLKQTAISAYRMLLVVGMFGLPLLPVMWQAVRAQSAGCSPGERHCCGVAAMLAIVLVGAPFVATKGRACLTQSTGTTIQNAHWGPVLLSDQDEPGRWGDLDGVAWPLAVWQVLTACAIGTIGMLAWWAAWLMLRCRRSSDDEPLPALAIGFLAAGAVAGAFFVVMITYTYDRYWLLMLAPMIIAIGLIARISDWRPSRNSLCGALLILSAYFVCSVVFIHDHLVWNDLRWGQVHTWLREGLSPREIDGGLEVNSWYRLAEDPLGRDRDGDPTVWWSGFATHSIAAGPRAGWIEYNRLPWHSWATGRRHELVILRKAEWLGTRERKDSPEDPDLLELASP